MLKKIVSIGLITLSLSSACSNIENVPVPLNTISPSEDNSGNTVLVFTKKVQVFSSDSSNTYDLHFTVSTSKNLDVYELRVLDNMGKYYSPIIIQGNNKLSQGDYVIQVTLDDNTTPDYIVLQNTSDLHDKILLKINE